MLRQNLIRRLHYLRNWELINIFFLPACLYPGLWSLKVQTWQPYGYALFVVCLILTQGVLYWHLKLQVISHKASTLPSYFSHLFSFFRWANVVLLSVYLVLVICDQIVSLGQFQVSAGSNAIFLFAILEYINYYYYQLSHDNLNDIRFLIKHKKIRRSPLSVDLQKSQAQVQKQEAG